MRRSRWFEFRQDATPMEDPDPVYLPIRHAIIIGQTDKATIRQWARRGRVRSCCDITTREIEYAFADLVHCEAETRRNENSAAA